MMNLKESRAAHGKAVKDRLKAAISEVGTVGKTANKSGISRSSFYAITNGESELALNHAGRIAAALNVTPRVLVFRLLDLDLGKISNDNQKDSAVYLPKVIKDKISSEQLNHKDTSKALGLSVGLFKFMDGRRLKVSEIPALAECLRMSSEELVNAII